MWGRDYFGGSDNQSTDFFQPIVVDLTKDLKTTYICCGASHVMFLNADGRVYGIGSDGFGQIGGGKRDPRISHPMLTGELLGTNIVNISAGRSIYFYGC